MSGTEDGKGEREGDNGVFEVWLARTAERLRQYEPSISVTSDRNGVLNPEAIDAGAGAFYAAINLYETGRLNGDEVAAWVYLAMAAQRP